MQRRALVEPSGPRAHVSFLWCMACCTTALVRMATGFGADCHCGFGALVRGLSLRFVGASVWVSWPVTCITSFVTNALGCTRQRPARPCHPSQSPLPLSWLALSVCAAGMHPLVAAGRCHLQTVGPASLVQPIPAPPRFQAASLFITATQPSSSTHIHHTRLPPHYYQPRPFLHILLLPLLPPPFPRSLLTL
jgi:hypothetical protein